MQELMARPFKEEDRKIVWEKFFNFGVLQHQYIVYKEINETVFSFLFDKFLEEGYVFTQEIHHNQQSAEEEIIGIARIVPEEGLSHFVSLETLIVNPNYRGQGHGRKIFEYLVDRIKNDPKYSGKTLIATYCNENNTPVRKITKHAEFGDGFRFLNFYEQAPDSESYVAYHSGRFFYHLLLEAGDRVKEVGSFEPQLPSEVILDPHDDSFQVVKINDNSLRCIRENRALATFQFYFLPETEKVSHILLGTAMIHEEYDPKQDKDVLKTFLCEMFVQQGLKYGKKNTLTFTHDPSLVEVFKEIGFRYLGEREGGVQVKEGNANVYYNEAFMDLGFFGVEDALEMLAWTKAKFVEGTSDITISEIKNIEENLIQWKAEIQKVFPDSDSSDCQMYMKRYLENFAFQMVQDQYGGEAPYYSTQEDAPWREIATTLLESSFCSDGLKDALEALLQNLNICFEDFSNRNHCFF